MKKPRNLMAGYGQIGVVPESKDNKAPVAWQGKSFKKKNHLKMTES